MNEIEAAAARRRSSGMAVRSVPDAGWQLRGGGSIDRPPASGVDAAAASLLVGMTRADRWLVAAWRRAGCDLTDAMLNSGVLVGSGARRHPSQASGDVVADYVARLQPVDSRRSTAEHEAAHAVTAEALGIPVHGVRLAPHAGDAAGVTELDLRAADPVDAAAAFLAAEVWGSLVTPDVAGGSRTAGCRLDRRAAARLVDEFGLQRATRIATAVLAERRADVLALADHLEHYGQLDLSETD